MFSLLLAPVWHYDDLRLEGWTVRAESALVHSDAWSPVREELDRQLRNIVRVVPNRPLAFLRRVTFWIRRDDPSTPCAAYHPGAEWLREHGTDPAMVKGVEIANVRNFVDWSHRAQFWMVLHELAHAYHDGVLGFDEPRVRTAYDAAVRSGAYDRVYRRTTPTGKTERHYALTNPMEFFAETTEAYFGENDFYPFDRAELRRFDPTAYQLMVNVWGMPKNAS